MYTNNSNKIKSQESAVLRNRIVTMKNLLFLAFSMILYSFSQSAVLDTQEVVLLTQIWGKLGLQLWHFDCNQWNGDTYLTCDCSFGSNTPCHVTRIGIAGEYVSASLPSEFAKLPYLQSLHITYNYLTGNIPSEWDTLRLTNLHMQGCSLEGPIPSSISTLIQLSDLRISDLKSGSSTFPSLEKMTKLNMLVLRNCLLNGTFPNYFVDMAYLLILDLSFNKLSGKIPSTYSLRYIYLTKNNLSGPLPRWILSSTKNVDVSYNHFTWNASAPKKCPQGTINLIGSYSSSTDNHVDPCLRKNFPCTKSKAQQIYSLHINCGGEEVYINNTIKFDDDTEGKGASSYYNHGNWAFSNTGNFMDYEADSDPYTISNTSDLQNISTYDTELYITARATAISLTYYGLCLMNGNYKVKLHFAEIAFTQHNSSNILGKRVFDIYVQGILRVKNFDIVKEAGGIGRAVIKSYSIIVENNTLEIQLYWAGKGTTSIPYAGSYGPIISAISVEPNFKPPKFGKKNKVGLVAGTTVGGVFALILLFVVLRRKGYITGRNSQQDLIGTDLQTGIFTWKQIKDATKNFDPSNKLGEGGFGAVYKGKLSDGTLIAVKLPSPNSKQGINEFLREIGTLAMLKHENLVKLYGFSINRTKYALIYEYMENNSLSHALFGSDEEIKKKLTWQVRLKICKDIARGLAYLHENDITHRDIKPSNVLLDRNFNAKISDFGLAELIDEENTNVNNCAGTMAYMAPEYAMRGILSTKVDVYSFGIVAIEIVSGKRIDCTLVEEDCYNLIEMATTLVNEGNILKLVDPDLRSDYSKKEASVILNTGLLCTHNRPDLRPNMSEATDMLEGRKDAERLLKRNPMNHSNTRARNHAWNEHSVSNRVVVDETYTNSTVANARAGNHAWSEPSVSIRVVDETNTESTVANTNNDGPNSLKILLAFMVVAGGTVSRVQGR